MDDATGKGARVLAGGFIPGKGTRLSRGQFYPPTLLVDVTSEMRIWREEIFGPIMCVSKVRVCVCVCVCDMYCTYVDAFACLCADV